VQEWLRVLFVRVQALMTRVCIDAAVAVAAALHRAHLQLQLQLVFFLKPLSWSASTYGTQLNNLQGSLCVWRAILVQLKNFCGYL
jgi:hypothetical protein